MEGSDEFLSALEKAAECRINNTDIPLTGFLRFESRSKTDQSYQDAFNVLISLNLILIEKINRQTEILNRILRGKQIEQDQEQLNLDSIIKAINDLSIKDSTEKRESIPSKYVFWEASKNDE